MFKPEGLKLPDCECFRKKAKIMNVAIDTLAAEYFVMSLQDAKAINLCSESRDYFYAAIIWQMLSGVLNVTKEDFEIYEKTGQAQGFEHYRKQYEEAYERLRPLVMQRIDYADGVIMSAGR